MTDYNLRQVNDSPAVENAYLWDWTNINLGLTIADGRFVKHDDFVLLFATATWGKGFKRKEDYKWQWKEGEVHNVMLQFWTKPREVADFKTKEKRTEQPSDAELFMGWLCDNFESGHFAGSLTLIHSSVLKMCYTGTGDDGNPIPDATRDMLSSTVQKLGFIEPPEGTVWTDDLMASLVPKSYTKKSGGYGSSKGQTEAERLNDRVEWLKKAVAEVSGWEIDKVTLSGLIANPLMDESAKTAVSPEQLDILLRIMG